MEKGGWVYIMADRYRGTIYIGVTSNIAARTYAHRRTPSPNLSPPGRGIVWRDRLLSFDAIGTDIHHSHSGGLSNGQVALYY